MQVKHSGGWKNATPHCKVGGTWVTPKEVWVKDSGVWKKEWAGSLFTAIAQGYKQENNTFFYGWARSSSGPTSLNFYDFITGDTITPAELEPKATIMYAYMYIDNANAAMNYFSFVVHDMTPPEDKQPPNTTGWMGANRMWVNGIGPFVGGFTPNSDAKAGTQLGQWFCALGANGQPELYSSVKPTPAQASAILAAAAQPNQLVFTFTKE